MRLKLFVLPNNNIWRRCLHFKHESEITCKPNQTKNIIQLQILNRNKIPEEYLTNK